jgi:hypothetical protein
MITAKCSLPDLVLTLISSVFFKGGFTGAHTANQGNFCMFFYQVDT